MFAVFLLFSLQGFEAAPPTPFDRVFPLTIDAQDPLLAGHGHAERVEYTADFSGTLHVWTTSGAGPGAEDELDLFLRVETPEGQLVQEDDKTGGRKVPYVGLAIEPGRKYVVAVAVAVASGEATGRLGLHLMAAPETDVTRASGAEAERASAAASQLIEAKDLDAARALVVKTLDALVAVPGGEVSELVRRQLWVLGNLSDELSIPELAKVSGLRALRHIARTLPPDHRDRLGAQMNLAVPMRVLGDLRAARDLFKAALAGFTRTLPDDDPILQLARQNLANASKELDDVATARTLEEKVLAVYSSTLPDDAFDLQWARQCHATTLKLLGDVEGARALEEKVLDVVARTLDADDQYLQMARVNLASTLKDLGELGRARALEEMALEVDLRTLQPDDRSLQELRVNLAATLDALGDAAGARLLLDAAIESYSRTVPDDDLGLQHARGNLAVMLDSQGDHEAAHDLQARVVKARSSALSADNPDLLVARLNLAATSAELGDLEGARSTLEDVLEISLQTFGEDHPLVRNARENLASILRDQGDLANARAIQERFVEVLSRTYPEDHPDLQVGRAYLVQTIVGQLASAPPGTLGNRDADELRERERAYCTELVTAICRALVRAARTAQLGGSSREAEERCAHIASQLGPAISLAAGYGIFEPIAALDSEAFLLSETTRGAALVAAALRRTAGGLPRYAELQRELREASHRLTALTESDSVSDDVKRALLGRDRAERELAELAGSQPGMSPSELKLDVGALGAKLSRGDALVGFRRYGCDRFERVAPPDSAGAAGFIVRSVENLCAFVLRPARPERQEPRGGTAAGPFELTRVELGPLAPIRQAVQAWRQALEVDVQRGQAVVAAGRGVGGTAEAGDDPTLRGRELRRLVFDPLLPALLDVHRLVVALDDVLHLVPLDALPLDAAGGAAPEGRQDTGVPPGEDPGRNPRPSVAQLVGDRWRIETRSTLTELLGAAPPATTGSLLVALGGAAFNSKPLAFSADEQAGEEPAAKGAERADPSAPAQIATILRDSTWNRGFGPLTHTADEARGIGALYKEAFEGQRPSRVLEERQASRAALVELAPKARFLHVATHGWVAPETVRSSADTVDADESRDRRAMFADRSALVKGMSPMLLCGLALTGANLSEDALGRVPGLVTAEELSTLDLSNCELAVLSACDTSVGARRAGQGVHSLQMALQMAGARSVITSLWSVLDGPTKVLMLEFYRRLWIEKEPKGQALWEAKRMLRTMKDDRGHPRYTTRDWAAWVLTGEPE